jgi:hypothetical protein
MSCLHPLSFAIFNRLSSNLPKINLKMLQNSKLCFYQRLWENHLFFNSAEYAEADIYNVFEKIINIQGDMYKT